MPRSKNVSKYHSWDVFAVPLGGPARERVAGTRYDPPRPLVLKGAAQGLPQAAPFTVRLAHSPAYMLRAAAERVPVDLDSQVMLLATLGDMSVGRTINESAEAIGTARTSVFRARGILRDMYGVSQKGASGELQTVARALMLGDLPFERRIEGPVLTSRRVRSLAYAALGGVQLVNGSEAVTFSNLLGIENRHQSVVAAFEVGALVVGPAYGPEEHAALAAMPGVLQSRS